MSIIICRIVYSLKILKSRLELWCMVYARSWPCSIIRITYSYYNLPLYAIHDIHFWYFNISRLENTKLFFPHALGQFFWPMTLTNAESFDLFHQVVFPKGTMGHFSLTNNYFFGKTHLVYQLRRKGIGSGHVREMSVRVGGRDRVFGGTGDIKENPFQIIVWHKIMFNQSEINSPQLNASQINCSINPSHR